VRYVDAIISAFDSLRANPVRGALTLLGIVIGVAAVILVVAIGSGASEVVMQEIRSLGSNLLVVASGPAFVAPGAPSLSVSVPDAVAIKQNIDEVDLAVPVVQRDVQVVRGDLNLLTHLFGVSPGFLAARDWVVGSGRDFTPDEARIGSKVALIGQTVANTLFGAADPVGAVVRINQVPLTVIGVLAPKGPTTSGRDQDDLVITPLITMRAHLFVMGRATNWIVDSILSRSRTRTPSTASSRMSAPCCRSAITSTTARPARFPSRTWRRSPRPKRRRRGRLPPSSRRWRRFRSSSAASAS
jgi:putative ABC transport system permease protein